MYFYFHLIYLTHITYKNKDNTNYDIHTDLFTAFIVFFYIFLLKKSYFLVFVNNIYYKS